MAAGKVSSEVNALAQASEVLQISQNSKAPSDARAVSSSTPPSTEEQQHRGLWVAHLHRYLDPQRKTLVWGAPSIDRPDLTKKS